SFVSSANFASGQTLALKQRRGYCRTCAKPAGPFVDVDAGTLTLTVNAINGNLGNGNTATLSATYQNPPGGTFSRNGAPFLLLSVID
ncbi:MAG TPA: hypothetical protein PLI00_03925, partial [Pseudomonadota bacterium]|nr:hypothetical protein [Pseudomonadota bacterium]